MIMLQMPVYREISTVEPKIMWSMSWRQLAAAIIMLCLGVPTYLSCWLLLGVDPSLAILAIFPVVIPPAIYGWVRPRGMNPESFFVYMFHHWTEPRTMMLDGEARRISVPPRPSMKEK